MANTNDTEEWRTIPDWPEYQVSSLGRVRSSRFIAGRGRKTGSSGKWRIIAGGVDKNGYKKFILTRDKEPKRYCMRLCSMVTTLFHGPKPEDCVATHLNGNCRDDRACNLAWRSQKDNMSDKVGHGTAQRGSRHANANLNEFKVLQIKRLLRDKTNKEEILSEFDVTPTQLMFIEQGKNWSFIDPNSYDMYQDTPCRKRRTKIDREFRSSAAVWLKSIGMSSSDIAIILDCSPITVNRQVRLNG